MFSGGSFIYVPPGVKVAHPLQAYFRINAENFGQFERTLIIVDEGSEVTYMEGCTAPKFSTSTLHSAVVELVALKGAKIQYITVQNWAPNVFNLVTKRGLAHEEAEIKWIDCNIGSRLTMKYPGRRAQGPQVPRRGHLHRPRQRRPAPGHRRQDGPRRRRDHVLHRRQIHLRRPGPQHLPRPRPHPAAPQGLQEQHRVRRAAHQHQLRTDTYPAITVRGQQHAVQHEASVSKVSEEMIFYMQSRGLTEAQAMSLAVNGFVNDLVRQFPMEYSVELKRLIDLEMEGSVG